MAWRTMSSVIQISCLGKLGRFGNSLFQYAFARGYAESIGATLQTPYWIGRTLFGLNDPPVSTPLPRLGLDEFPNGQTNVDLYGYLQFSKCFDFYTITKLREWFDLTPSGLLTTHPYVSGVVSAHLRRGDYETTYAHVYCTIHDSAYKAAAEQYGYQWSDINWVRENALVNPLVDFMKLYNSDVMFRANSTFSWWAATLGHAKKVFSPIVDGLKGPVRNVSFVEGNHPRCVDLPNVSDYTIKP